MKSMRNLLFVGLAAALAWGCDEPSTSDPAPSDPKGEATPVATGGKDTFNSAGYKADCLNCDADGPNAFVQLGLGDRFWKVGDSWKVVYLLRADTRTQRQPIGLDQPNKVDAGLVSLTFEVVSLGSRATDGLERPTATIRITQGAAPAALQQVVAAQEVPLKELTARVELELDDLLRPVSVTEFGGPRGAYPHGKLTKLDPRDVVRNLGSAFPYIVPNAYIGADKRTLPELPEALRFVAPQLPGDFASREYFHFDMKGFGAESAEQVYWAEGDLWPFLVETPSAIGVLVSQNK